MKVWIVFVIGAVNLVIVQGYAKLPQNRSLRKPAIFRAFDCGVSQKFWENHVNGYHTHDYPETSENHARRKRWVVGGQEAAPGEFPWMALIGQMNGEEITWMCDGVLIHPSWVLTAAHCLLEFSTHVVRLGEHNISSNDEVIQDFIVTDFRFHPEFKLDVNYHDLAMVKLPEAAQLTDTVLPICLPWKKMPKLVGNIATLAGWGAEEFGGGLSMVLRDADVKVFNSSVCDKSYSTLRDYDTLWPSGIKGKFLLCAAGPNGGIDACQGDSGGPLMFPRNDRLELIGVVSKGFGCGLKEFPGIYIAVRTYLIWICDVILGRV